MSKSININGSEYALQLKDNVAIGGEAALGVFMHSEMRIEVATDGVHERCQAETLLHESMHGMLCSAGKAEHDEEIMTILDQGVVSLLRNNRWLVPVLLGDKTLEDAVMEQSQ